MYPVEVEDWVIGDGQIPPPRVGDQAAWWLQFHECAPTTTDDPAPTTLRADATPSGAAGPWWEGDGMRWGTTLYGVGWNASWRAPRPSIGGVEPTGTLLFDWEGQAHGRPATRGRISRVRVLVRTQRRSTDRRRGWEDVPGSDRWIDVERAPRCSFTPDSGRCRPDGTRSHPIRLVVDLDLDAAEPVPLRAPVAPGDVAAAGRTLWAADRHLPVVLRRPLDAPDEATVTVLPMAVPPRLPGRRAVSVHPYPDGCAVRAGGTLFLLDREGAVRDDVDPVADVERVGVTDDGWLLVVGDHATLTSPEWRVHEVRLPEGVELVGTARGRGDAVFVCVLRGAEEGRHRLALVDERGGVTTGPDTEPLDRPVSDVRMGRDGVPQVTGPSRLWTFTPDLEHVDTRPLDRAWAAGFVGEHLWTVGRDDGDVLELRVLDPDELTVRAVTSTGTREPRPTLDADGTLWISSPTQRGLRADGSVVELDLAAESWRARPLPVRPLDSGGSWRSGQ